MKKLLYVFSRVVYKVALSGADHTSGFNTYQPALPAKLMK